MSEMELEALEKDLKGVLRKYQIDTLLVKHGAIFGFDHDGLGLFQISPNDHAGIVHTEPYTG